MDVARICFAVALLTGGAAVAGPTDSLIRIDAKDCARLVRHVPQPDVAYRPGVDSRGRPVAPADLGGGTQLPIGEITIPIEIDLASRNRLPKPHGRLEAEAQIGTVTLKNGQVLFNGQIMGDYEQHAVAEACKAQGFR